jgi:hypothetical protein
MVLYQLIFYKILIESDIQVSTLEWLEEIVLNRNIKSVLIFDINLVGGDEVVVAPFLAAIIIATWQVVEARGRGRSRRMLELLSCR